jgi:DNA primase
MAIFEKKLRSIANKIKDNYIKKYVLEYFIEKISGLTPYTSQNQKNFYTKKTRSLDKTKKHFNESQSLSGIELKEFSLIYLVVNNLNLMRDHIHLLKNVKLFSEVNKQIFEKILFKLSQENNLSIDHLDIDTQLIDKITKFAPIKHILQKKNDQDHEILELLEDIIRDLNNYDLEFRIQELESRLSKDLSETTFNELKELKKKQNIN